MITIDHVSKSFGNRHVLRDCCLEIKRGETTVIIGSSGTGKSTLLRTIIGLTEPDAGRVLVDGKDVHAISPRELSELRSRIGYLFQSGALAINWLTVAENLALPLLERTRLPRPEIDRRIDRALDLVDLRGTRDLRPDQPRPSSGSVSRSGCRRPPLRPASSWEAETS